MKRNISFNEYLRRYFCLACYEYLGVSDSNMIPDSNIQASSFSASDRLPEYARLNGFSHWQSNQSDSKPWIQADLGYQTQVSGVVTQGDGGIGGPSIDFIKSFSVSTFLEKTSDPEMYVKESGSRKVCRVYYHNSLIKIHNTLFHIE